MCLRSAPKFIIVPPIILYLLFICTYSDGKFKVNKRVYEEHQAALTPKMGLINDEMPFCVGNLLDQQLYHLSKEVKQSYGNSRLMVAATGSYCRLQNYTMKRVVTCLDFLGGKKKHRHQNSPLQLVFIGDSRMRQQFLNFIRVIPDYDRKSDPSPIPFIYHGDIEVTSNILRMRFSFRWRPVISDIVVQAIRQLALSISTQWPYLIFISIEVHHMLTVHGASYKLYEKRLSELVPILAQLSNVSNVIWLNQYPTVDSYARNGAHNTDITSEKIHNYNKMIRRIIENQNSSIRIWDSGNPLAEEYVRGCAIITRFEKRNTDRDYTSSYSNCRDYIHSGYSALGQVTQLLYNDICTEEE